MFAYIKANRKDLFADLYEIDTFNESSIFLVLSDLANTFLKEHYSLGADSSNEVLKKLLTKIDSILSDNQENKLDRVISSNEAVSCVMSCVGSENAFVASKSFVSGAYEEFILAKLQSNEALNGVWSGLSVSEQNSIVTVSNKVKENYDSIQFSPVAVSQVQFALRFLGFCASFSLGSNQFDKGRYQGMFSAISNANVGDEREDAYVLFQVFNFIPSLFKNSLNSNDVSSDRIKIQIDTLGMIHSMLSEGDKSLSLALKQLSTNMIVMNDRTIRSMSLLNLFTDSVVQCVQLSNPNDKQALVGNFMKIAFMLPSIDSVNQYVDVSAYLDDDVCRVLRHYENNFSGDDKKIIEAFVLGADKALSSYLLADNPPTKLIVADYISKNKESLLGFLDLYLRDYAPVGNDNELIHKFLISKLPLSPNEQQDFSVRYELLVKGLKERFDTREKLSVLHSESVKVLDFFIDDDPEFDWSNSKHVRSFIQNKNLDHVVAVLAQSSFIFSVYDLLRPSIESVRATSEQDLVEICGYLQQVDLNPQFFDDQQYDAFVNKIEHNGGFGLIKFIFPYVPSACFSNVVLCLKRFDSPELPQFVVNMTNSLAQDESLLYSLKECDYYLVNMLNEVREQSSLDNIELNDDYKPYLEWLHQLTPEQFNQVSALVLFGARRYLGAIEDGKSLNENDRELLRNGLQGLLDVTLNNNLPKFLGVINPLISGIAAVAASGSHMLL